MGCSGKSLDLAQVPSLEYQGVELMTSPAELSNFIVSVNHLGVLLVCSPESVGLDRVGHSAFFFFFFFLANITSSQVMPKLLVHGLHSKE